MRHNLSPKKNLDVLVEAFLGTRGARDVHRASLAVPITITSGLAALRERWPELRSSNQSSPVFIFSAGWRSGSTLLQRWVMTDNSTLIWGEPYSQAGLLESLAGQLRAFTREWPRDDFFAANQACGEALSRTWVANLYPSLVHFMEAHVGFFEAAFLKPALAQGKCRWGIKEVTLGVDYARYLRWLFPDARFLFLYRDPNDAYASYRKWRYWYRSWPDAPVFTASDYGAIWNELASDFVNNHGEVGGLLLQYEALKTRTARSQLEEYLGSKLADPASLARVDGSDADTKRKRARPHWVPKIERFLLRRQVEPLRTRLGYGTKDPA